jgi:hypothetical protein
MRSPGGSDNGLMAHVVSSVRMTLVRSVYGSCLMLFSKPFWEPIQSGDVTLTFRRWKRQQVVADRVYRSPAGRIHVTDVAVVTADAITDGDARRAGHRSAAALREELRGSPADPVYRIEFRYLDEPDPRDLLVNDAELSSDDIAGIDQRLARLDRAGKHGPWTRRYLELIEEHPGVRAPDLAELVGRETQPFKTDVRKLKNLGLTISQRVGYRLSPRGAAYLRRSGPDR